MKRGAWWTRQPLAVTRFVYAYVVGRDLIHITCKMVPEVTLHRQYDSGSVYEFRSRAVFVPSGLSDQVGVDVETDEDAVRAADSPHQPIPPGVAVFEDNDRDAPTRACLWASVQDRIDLDSPLEWSEAAPDDCRRVRTPVVVAAEGNAVLAAYLASYGFPNDEIANALGVGSRTVSQYLSDFRKGER